MIIGDLDCRINVSEPVLFTEEQVAAFDACMREAARRARVSGTAKRLSYSEIAEFNERMCEIARDVARNQAHAIQSAGKVLISR